MQTRDLCWLLKSFRLCVQLFFDMRTHEQAECENNAAFSLIVFPERIYEVDFIIPAFFCIRIYQADGVDSLTAKLRLLYVGIAGTQDSGVNVSNYYMY